MKVARVRLSLRFMMVAVLIVGCGLGWVIRLDNGQREIVAEIRKAGGSVVYASQRPDRPAFSGFLLRISSRFLGPHLLDYFDDVEQVHLGPKAKDALMSKVGRFNTLEALSLNSGITDLGMARVRSLTGIEELDLSASGVSGAGLKYVVGMTKLRRLELPFRSFGDADLVQLRGLTSLKWLQGGWNSTLTDAGLVPLEGLVNLETLSLYAPGITSTGLNSLRKMVKLRHLNLIRTKVVDLAPIRHLTKLDSLGLTSSPIDDVGMRPIAGFRNLTDLYLEGTNVGDGTMALLRDKASLVRLRLSGTRITDAGLANLAGLTNLEDLELNETMIGDEGLTQLAGLNKLKLLFVEGTRITDAGLLACLKGLKSCKQVVLGKTAVTSAGVHAAQELRPRVKFFGVGN
ncbi:leucine-rich repeat domain-containing protein [Singulisphaera rosea]